MVKNVYMPSYIDYWGPSGRMEQQPKGPMQATPSVTQTCQICGQLSSQRKCVSQFDRIFFKYYPGLTTEFYEVLALRH